MSSQPIIQVLVPATLAESPGMLHFEIVNGPPSGTATWTREFDTDLGLVDAISRVIDYVPTPTDPLGQTDAAVRSAAFDRTSTDNRGLSDSSSQVADYASLADDGAGLVDDIVTELT